MGTDVTLRIRHIVQELQKETATSAQRCKVLESENKLLLSETEQLREVRSSLRSPSEYLVDALVQDLKALEEDVERSLSREEAMLSGEYPSSPPTPSMDDMQTLQRSYKDLKTKYEASRPTINDDPLDLNMLIYRVVRRGAAPQEGRRS